jgi:hypothetical protein
LAARSGQFLLIVLLATTASVAYGIVHDQVTVRISPEYFTIGHPPVRHHGSLTLLGLYWGLAATWWAGLTVGLILAVAARAGRSPGLTARDLIGPVLSLTGIMALCAASSGFAAGALSDGGCLKLLPPLSDSVPAVSHRSFLVAAGAHQASYAAGFLGGAIMAVLTWRRRKMKLVADDGD